MRDMKVKNTAQYRKFIQEREQLTNYDPNFIGSTHGNKMGFFKIMHGIKDNIKNFLRGELQNAEDDQAIYEFIQNAADCDSSEVFIFYNEKYFLAINNGNPFENSDIESILNIKQSSKEGQDKIGRYGIGFKLVHRLVGKEDGLKELIEDYKGPIIFSWKNENQFKELLSYSNANKIEHVSWNTNDVWLFKIILTCFPTAVNERVLDLNYKENILFQESELIELVDFLNQKKVFLSEMNKSKGSIFFLKFGENKSNKLNASVENLKLGIQYSLNFLKSLKKVVINKDILNEFKIKREEFLISVGSEDFKKINPEFDSNPIKIIVGYPEKIEKAFALRTAPNIYQFFPMGDEIHGLAFIIHSTSFVKETNRRKLSESSDINKATFDYITKKLIEKLNIYKESDRTKYQRFFLSILSSKPIKRENNKLVVDSLYIPLLSFIKNNVITKSHKHLSQENVWLKETKLLLNPSDFGIDGKEWFYWPIDSNKESEEEKVILQQVNKKNEDSPIPLESMNITDLIFYAGSMDGVNAWLLKHRDQLELFIKELNQYFSHNYTNNQFVENFQNLKFLEFPDRNIFSLSELADKKNYLVLNKKTSGVAKILENIGFKISNIDISLYGSFKQYSSVFKLDYLQDDEVLFNLIQQKLEGNVLPPLEKESLFLNLINPETKFTGIGEEKLKKIKLFSNNKGVVSELGRIVHPDGGSDSWLTPFKIKQEEFFPSIAKYLVKKEDVYHDIIRQYWHEITSEPENLNDISNFYRAVIESSKLKPGNLNLTDQNYIYVDKEKGFIGNDLVFFNKELKNVKKYEVLNSVIGRISGLVLPNQKILDFLESPPFSTKGDNIKIIFDEFTEIELSEEELIQLIYFIEQNRDSVFKYFVISKREKHYLIRKRTEDIVQYSSEIKEIEKYSSNRDIFPLPYELIPSITLKDGLFDQNEVTSLLLDKHFSNNLIELVFNREINIENKISFLLQISEEDIQIDLEKEYHSDHLLLKCLDMAYYLFKDSQEKKEFEIFRNRLKIKTNRKVYSIDEVSINNDVTFSFFGENQQYTLSLDKILPNKYSNASILDSILQKLNNLEKYKIDFIFSVNKEMKKEFIFLQLQNAYSILINSHQLAFICLYAKNTGDTELLSHFQLEDKVYFNQKKIYYYLTEKNYLSKDNLIPSRFSELDKLLKLKEEQPVFYIESSFYILLEPAFIEDSFICVPLKYELCNDIHAQKELFFDIHSAWNKHKKMNINFIPTVYFYGTPNQRIYNSCFSSFSDESGFINKKANNYIYPNQYAVKEEQLPDWVLEWIESSNTDRLGNEEFMKSLGVNTLDSTVVQVRKYLQSGEGNISKEIIGNLGDYYDSIYNNTTLWLAKEKVKIASENLERLNWVKEIYKNIEDDIEYALAVIIQEDMENFKIEFHLFEKSSRYFTWTGKINESIEIQDNIAITIEDIINQKQRHNYIILDGNILEIEELYTKEIKKITELLSIQLDKKFIQNNYREFNRKYYLEWKKLLNVPITVYEIDKDIPYTIFLDDIVIKSVFVGQIAIEDDIIVFSKKIDFYSEDLIEFLGRGFFDQTAFDLLKKAKKDFPDEIIQIKKELQTKLNDPAASFSDIQNLTFKLLKLDTLNSRFSVDSGIITKLGEELVSKSQTAIAEIVKNTFDADATLCKVIFQNIGLHNASIIIQDDGSGMTREQLIQGFMRISTKEKIDNPYSPIYKRKRAGEKGIGRFATQKLGHKLTIITQTELSNTAWKLIIDWKMYEDSQELSSIENPLITIDKQLLKGTIIIIEELKDPWDEIMIKKLYHYIYSIQSPYKIKNLVGGDPGFNTQFIVRIQNEDRLIADEESEIYSYALAEIDGKIDESGFGAINIKSKRLILDEVITIYRQKDLPFNILKEIHFKMYYFLYINDYIPRTVLNSIKEFGKQNGGIRLYRNGFRVLPYGEKGDDWLGLDESSSKRTVKLPHANMNFIGYVSITDIENKIFKETSSREGLIQTEGYNELKILIYKSLVRAASKILEIRGLDSLDVIPEKVQEIKTILEESRNSKLDINFLIEKVKELEETIEQLSETTDEKRLLRILAGLGLVIGEFTHEIKGSVPAIRQDAMTIERKVKTISELNEITARLIRNVSSLETYSTYFANSYSNNSRRHLKPINVLEELNVFFETIENDLTIAKISVEKDHIKEELYYTCPMHPSEWTSIFFNLYTNAKKAINRAMIFDGKIRVNLSMDEENVYFEFMDNGDGIKDEIKGRIFEPFVSIASKDDYDTENQGSGLGLYIIREILSGYGGTIKIVEPSRNFKTCFKISTPIKKEGKR